MLAHPRRRIITGLSRYARVSLAHLACQFRLLCLRTFTNLLHVHPGVHGKGKPCHLAQHCWGFLAEVWAGTGGTAPCSSTGAFTWAWLQGVTSRRAGLSSFLGQGGKERRRNALRFKVRTATGGGKTKRGLRVVVACDLFAFKNKVLKPEFPFCGRKGLERLVLGMFSVWALVLLFALLSSNKSLEYVLK